MKRIAAIVLLLVAAVLCRAQANNTYGNITSGASTCTPTSCVYFQIPANVPWLVVNVTGTWSGTIQVQAVLSPYATYQNLNSQTWTLMNTITANQTMSVATGGANFILVQAPTWASGNAAISISTSATGTPLANPVFLGNTTSAGYFNSLGQAIGGNVTVGSGVPTGTCTTGAIYYNSAASYAQYICGGDAAWHSTGGGITGTPGITLTTDALGNLDAKGVISSYNGAEFIGDSNTACYGFAVIDANHCEVHAVALAETGSDNPLNYGYGGINLLDQTWFLEMYANINPTVTGNPIQHVDIGTNTVRFLNPNTQPPAAWVTALNQEMYEIAIHETTGPQEKYLPNDPVYATSTGTWTPTFNFVAVAGPIVAGTGYSVNDVLLITGTGFQMTVDTIGAGGSIGFSHVSTFPTPPYNTPVPPLATTGGTGAGATYDPLYLNKTNYTYISTGATDSITYSNVLVEQSCAFLNYEVWPLPGNPGGQTGSTFSVFADGSGTAMTDLLTGLTTISSNISTSEQGTGQNNTLGGYNGWKVAKLCGLSNGYHSFLISKISAGYEGIQYIASPRATLDFSLDGPNLNVEGIIPQYPNLTSGYTASIATYNQAYSNIVYDLAHNFGRRIVYTDLSTIDMNQNYYVNIGNQFWGNVQTCGIASGVVTLTEVYTPSMSANLPSVGQVLEGSNMTNCGVANGVLLVIQSVSGTIANATLTLVPEFPYSASGAAVATATVTTAQEAPNAVTELTMNGWIVNISGPLHMPQNAQMDAARRIENADRAAPGLPGTGGRWITYGQKSGGNYVSLFTDTSVPSTTNAIGSGINTGYSMQLAAPNTSSALGGVQFGQYTPAPSVDPGALKANYNWYAEFTNYKLNMLSKGLSTPTTNFGSSSINFTSSGYNDGVTILSQVDGSGASGSGTCAPSGGTFTHALMCTASLDGKGGVNAVITNPGDYTTLPTLVISGFGSLTGYSATLGWGNYMVILSQQSGTGYTNPTCSISGGTFNLAATCTAAVNIAGGAVATIIPSAGGSYTSISGATMTISDPTGSGFAAVLGIHSTNDTMQLASVWSGSAPQQLYLQVGQTSQPATSAIHGFRMNAVNNSGYTFNYTGQTAVQATFDASGLTLTRTFSLPNATATLAAFTGTLTVGDCIKVLTTATIGDSGAVCGTGSGTVTGVTATAPITSTGGTAPVIACATCAVTASPTFTGTVSLPIVTETGAYTNSTAGAASVSPALFSGAILTGGTGTTNFPQLFLQPSAATAATTWSTAGTFLGINSATGFTGNFLDFHLNGGTSVASINSLGFLSLGSGVTAQGSITGNLFKTNTHCSSAATPAVCSAAPVGFVNIAAAATTLVVNTTAVTANSTITVNWTNDATVGTALSVTCNATYNPVWVSARTAGTSFTITVQNAISTNPDCLTYSIVD